jgi:NADH-quinone oxidoreductase subunit C
MNSPHLLRFEKKDMDVFLVESCGILDVVSFFKNKDFKQLTDITAVDYLKKGYFEIIYHFLNYKKNERIRIKTHLKVDEKIESITPLFLCANWYEREVFDLFGVIFSNHPNLTRLLTDYNFKGHPLRKDFPLTGHVETFFDEKNQKVDYKPVHFEQAYRTFDFLTPWGHFFPKEDKKS